MVRFSRSVLAGSAIAAAFLASSAQAAAPNGFVGTFSADYFNTHFSDGGGNADTWGLNGAGAFGLGMNDLGAEINGSYHRLSVSSVDANIWGVGGSIFWAPGNGRFGPSVSYTKLDFTGAASGIDAHATTYGVFGEFFVNDMFTVGVKGGGTDGKVNVSGFGSGSGSGGYIGGELTGYAMPNLAIKGNIDYLDVGGSHVTNYGINAEYLVSEATPISVFGGYVRTDLSNGAGHGDTWLIGLKFYTNGAGSLVDHHRTGTLGNIGTVSGLQFAF
jgi:hypothetical protein